MSRAPEDFRGLTAAFLGGSSTGRDAIQAQAMPTLLIVGNVPTLAGIWIAQFADQQARSHGPIALIRLDGPASRGEIYRAGGRALPTEGGAWMERASAFARSWIVCTDAQTDPAAVAHSGCPLVLLSGTDEAALAAAKRTIESIVHARTKGSISRFDIGIAFVGSPEASAQAALQSLLEWAGTQGFDIGISLASHAPRVDRVESSGPVPLSMLSALDTAAALEFIGIAMRGSQSRFSETDRSMARAVATGPKLAPAAGNRPIDPPHALGSIVEEYFGEWSELAFHCPDAISVQLAIDDAGVLHLIQSGSNPNALRVAAGWARANWMLLSVACPKLNSNARRILEHMLLDDSRDGALLHRTGVLLHARVEVSVGGEVVRRRIDLNTESSAGIE